MFVSMLYRTWFPVAAAVGLASIGLAAQKGSTQVPVDLSTIK